MVGYALVVVIISLIFLFSGKNRIMSKVGYACLILMALCYLGLIALSMNIEQTVASNDANPTQNATGWFGTTWLLVWLGDVVLIVTLHIVLAVTRHHNGTIANPHQYDT